MCTQSSVTYIKVLCSDVHQLAAGRMQSLVDYCVCTFTVERELPLRTPNCKHKYRHTYTYMRTTVFYFRKGVKGVTSVMTQKMSKNKNKKKTWKKEEKEKEKEEKSLLRIAKVWLSSLQQFIWEITLNRSRYSQLSVFSGLYTYDGHPLADVVEVQDGQEFVAALLSHFHDGNAVRGTWAEDKTKVSGCWYQRSLVWRLGQVEKLTCRSTQVIFLLLLSVLVGVAFRVDFSLVFCPLPPFFSILFLNYRLKPFFLRTQNCWNFTTEAIQMPTYNPHFLHVWCCSCVYNSQQKL